MTSQFWASNIIDKLNRIDEKCQNVLRDNQDAGDQDSANISRLLHGFYLQFKISWGSDAMAPGVDILRIDDRTFPVKILPP
jgi:hypothetical protein